MIFPPSATLVAAIVCQDPLVALQITGDPKWVYLLLGIALLVIGIVDLLWTTLWADGGAGPLTASLMETVWRGMRKFGSHRSRVLSLSGPLVLALTLVTWVLLLWAGWTLVFASGGPNALNYTRGGDPVGWIDRLYFVGYTMFTMGNGDFTPTGGPWRMATALTNGSGMILLTLSVTYVINVLQAVVKSRSFASSVHGVAETSETFVETGWDGQNLSEHDLPLDRFATQVSTIASQHKAYPILHYYRSSDRRHATPLAVGVFDDALTLLRFGVASEARPNQPLLETARSSARGYLQSVYGLPVQSADRVPTDPDLTRLAEKDIPTVPEDEFDDVLGDLEKRRRKLLGVVESQAWQWPSEQNGDDQ